MAIFQLVFSLFSPNPLLLLCRTIHIISPQTHTHTHIHSHTHHSHTPSLFSPWGSQQAAGKLHSAKPLQPPFSHKHPLFSYPIPLVPFRALFPTTFCLSHTETPTHTHMDLLPFFSCGQHRLSGWSGLCHLFTKLPSKCCPGRMRGGFRWVETRWKKSECVFECYLGVCMFWGGVFKM